MKKVMLYLTDHCGYCTAAKALLVRKNIHFEEVRVDLDADALTRMMKLSGRRTVPQIFIGDQSIGGFDDLKALDDSGELDKLLT